MKTEPFPLHLEYGRPLVNPGLLSAFEKEFQVRLPESFKSIVTKQDGADLVERRVNVRNPAEGDDHIESINCAAFIPFQEPDGEEGEMFSEHRRESEVRPDGLIVFGEEGGGYLWAFDYRENPRTDSPPVVLIHRDNPPEHYVLAVAPSFEEFLGMLMPCD